MSVDLRNIKSGTAKKASENSLSQLLNKDISFKKKGLSDKRKEQFFKELYSLLNAGIDMRSALELFESDQRKGDEKEILQKLNHDVVEGKSLNEAMKNTKMFNDYETFSVRIGEESGKLNDVLFQIADYYNKKIEQKRKITSALSYPIIVITVAILAVAFMINFVVPKFADIFSRFKAELPAITKWMMNVSDSFGYYAGGFVSIVAVFVLLYLLNKNKVWMRRLVSSTLLKIPVVGPLIQLTYLSRFCQTMSLLISAKTPLIDSLKMVKEMISFYPLEAAIEQIEKDVMSGMLLNESMAQFNIFPKKLIYMIKVGEEVNKLDDIFNQMAEQYTEEVQYKSGLIGTVIEPIVIVLLGIFVVLILVAMYLPMFSMIKAVG